MYSNSATPIKPPTAKNHVFEWKLIEESDQAPD
jgi:hypothetical protein